MKRRERRLGGRLDPVGHHLLGGLIAGAKQAEAVDQQHLLERRAADEPAVVELRRREGAGEAGFAARDARNSALDEQARGNHPAPGGDPVEPRRGLVRVDSRCRAPRASVLSSAER